MVRDESGSVGGILPNVKLRFVDDDGIDVEPGETGEVLVQGPVVCQGYHDNEAANREAFDLKGGGWYRTGDVGYWKDGLVYLVDRKKEMIKYKGLQVAPAELEDVLMSYEKVADAAVVGVWVEELGTEVPKAFVVKSGEVEEREVVEFVKSSLASHKQLRGGVVFVEEIPKPASGKILRKELRKRAELKGGKAKL
jgi:acyl-CoA synthetase (AMP-forming)/AMP-acid ligase II